jgi:PhzF family phenazine biosynthesis protein
MIPIFYVDAFSEKLFSGNPAAVIWTDREMPSELMQSIAAENNLAETAFISGALDKLSIRWFTPTVEVDLCGHATLAAAHVLFIEKQVQSSGLSFASKSGILRVYKENDMLWLDFPVDRIIIDRDSTSAVEAALGTRPEVIYRGKTDLMAVLPSANLVASLVPDFHNIEKLPCRGLIVTARGNEVDFVSRFFAPQSGIPEDPVTGSAHTTLTPYWANVLGKRELTAKQLSRRTGLLWCREMGDRIHIGGKAITYLKGVIES